MIKNYIFIAGGGRSRSFGELQKGLGYDLSTSCS